MQRIHFVEIEDLPWCPAPIRDGATDWLQFMDNTHRAFDAIAPRLRAVLDRSGTSNVVDLCSGGSGPWLSLGETLARTGDVRVKLTDLYPNRAAFERAAEASNGRIEYHPTGIDASDVPAELEGVRTMFSAFHHFRPEQARAILADAVRKRRPIAIFEGTHSRLVGVLMVLLMPLMMWVLMPKVRPLRFSRLFFTYVIPALPALAWFDGIVSMLRVYSPEELRSLVEGVPGREAFDWEMGVQRVPGAPLGLTYLVGVPRTNVA